MVQRLLWLQQIQFCFCFQYLRPKGTPPVPDDDEDRSTSYPITNHGGPGLTSPGHCLRSLPRLDRETNPGVFWFFLFIFSPLRDQGATDSLQSSSSCHYTVLKMILTRPRIHGLVARWSLREHTRLQRTSFLWPLEWWCCYSWLKLVSCIG